MMGRFLAAAVVLACACQRPEAAVVQPSAGQLLTRHAALSPPPALMAVPKLLGAGPEVSGSDRPCQAYATSGYHAPGAPVTILDCKGWILLDGWAADGGWNSPGPVGPQGLGDPAECATTADDHAWLAPPDNPMQPQMVAAILHRKAKCVSLHPQAGLEQFAMATFRLYPREAAQPQLQDPLSVVSAPGGYAVLDHSPTPGKTVRVIQFDGWGYQPMVWDLALDPSPQSEDRFPHGLVFRGDGTPILAGADGVYVASAKSGDAKRIVTFGPGMAAAGPGGEENCCALGWLADPLWGGGILVRSPDGTSVLVYDDQKLKPIASWLPAAALPKFPRVRHLSTSAVAGMVTLVQESADGQTGRVALYAYPIVSAAQGLPTPAAPAKQVWEP